MAKSVSFWLDPKPAPDVRALTRDELQALWAANRNTLIGIMAAEEAMRRYQLEKGNKQ